MTGKLVMMRGLPGSGKSTYAKELVGKGFVRICKDDLRSMMSNGVWNGKREKRVVRVRDFIIRDVLESGGNVVVDDTNYNWEDHLRGLASEYSAKFEVIDVDTDVDTCIKRDLARENSVGASVIWRMYYEHVSPPEKYVAPEGSMEVILCDLDGTLALMNDENNSRSPYDWERVGEDAVCPAVSHILHQMQSGYESRPVILVSGRDEVCRSETEAWLEKHDIEYKALFMRPAGDKRKDTIVKREIFDREIRDKYAVLFVLDDRISVCRQWYGMGLPLLRVGDPDADF